MAINRPTDFVSEHIGYGRNATGGLGGTVYQIDSLADDSFRQIVEQGTGPRIIVPAVSGWIDLGPPSASAPDGGDVIDNNGNITILGAWRGNRIGLKNGGLRFNAPNWIVSNLRIYRGPEQYRIPGGKHTGDCVHVGPSSTDGIIDHCSLAYSMDENLGIRGKRITVQWTTLSHPLNGNPGQEEPNHGFNCLISEGADYITIRNCVFANAKDRNPLVQSGHVEIYNIVGVNCFTQAYLDGQASPYYCNAEGMVFIPGADSANDRFRIGPASPTGNRNYWCSSNNLSTNKPYGTVPSCGDSKWFKSNEGCEMATGRLSLSGALAFDARNTVGAIINYAGAEPNNRDAYQVGMMAEFSTDHTQDSTGGIITTPADLDYSGLSSGYPALD